MQRYSKAQSRHGVKALRAQFNRKSNQTSGLKNNTNLTLKKSNSCIANK